MGATASSESEGQSDASPTYTGTSESTRSDSPLSDLHTFHAEPIQPASPVYFEPFLGVGDGDGSVDAMQYLPVPPAYSAGKAPLAWQNAWVPSANTAAGAGAGAAVIDDVDVVLMAKIGLDGSVGLASDASSTHTLLDKALPSSVFVAPLSTDSASASTVYAMRQESSGQMPTQTTTTVTTTIPQQIIKVKRPDRVQGGMAMAARPPLAAPGSTAALHLRNPEIRSRDQQKVDSLFPGRPPVRSADGSGGGFNTWVLDLGTKERNLVSKVLEFTAEDKKKLVKASRSYKQTLAHKRYRVSLKSREDQAKLNSPLAAVPKAAAPEAAAPKKKKKAASASASGACKAKEKRGEKVKKVPCPDCNLLVSNMSRHLKGKLASGAPNCTGSAEARKIREAVVRLASSALAPASVVVAAAIGLPLTPQSAPAAAVDQSYR